MAYDSNWADVRKQYRRGVNKALKDIRQGSIEELDLDKLHNFCQIALLLMSKVQESVWRKAEMEAEIADLLMQEAMKEERDNNNGCTEQKYESGTCSKTVLGN